MVRLSLLLPGSSRKLGACLAACQRSCSRGAFHDTVAEKRQACIDWIWFNENAVKLKPQGLPEDYLFFCHQSGSSFVRGRNIPRNDVVLVPGQLPVGILLLLLLQAFKRESQLSLCFRFIVLSLQSNLKCCLCDSDLKNARGRQAKAWVALKSPSLTQGRQNASSGAAWSFLEKEVRSRNRFLGGALYAFYFWLIFFGKDFVHIPVSLLALQ